MRIHKTDELELSDREQKIRTTRLPLNWEKNCTAGLPELISEEIGITGKSGHTAHLKKEIYYWLLKLFDIFMHLINAGRRK